MHWWAETLITLCVLAVTGAVLATLGAARRAAKRAERVLAAAERQLNQDLPALLTEVRALLIDLRDLSGAATKDLERLEALADRVHTITASTGRVLGAIASFTRVGRLVGLAAGLKTGTEAFLDRLRRR